MSDSSMPLFLVDLNVVLGQGFVWSKGEPSPLRWYPASVWGELRIAASCKNDMYSNILALFSVFSYPYNFHSVLIDCVT
jgi:hypothetical protein